MILLEKSFLSKRKPSQINADEYWFLDKSTDGKCPNPFYLSSSVVKKSFKALSRR